MLEFNIKNQTISRVDRFNPATDSVDYLTAKFNFISTDWDGVTKKALFRSGTVSYEAAINASGVCKVPFEVLISPDNKFSVLSGGCIKIYISVVGTSGTMTIPTKECRVEIGASGLTETLNGATPTPNIYEQFVDTIKADNDTTVAEIKADNDETRVEVEALTERAETAQTSAEQSAASMKNDYANALKGKASGEVVRVDDVSPVEHNPVVKVKSKNLCPESALDNMGENGTSSMYDVSSRTITMTADPTGFAGYYCAPFKSMVVGENYTISFNIRGTVGKIVKCGWDKNGVAITLTNDFVRYSVTLTATKANEPIVFYSRPVANGGLANGEFMQFANVQIEEGDTATEYTPYIDPSTVTLTRCGKNLLPYPFSNTTVNMNGITLTDNGDGTLILNGTATSECVYFLLDNANLRLKGSFTFSGINGGAINKYYFQPVVDGVYQDVVIDGAKTFEFDGTLTRVGFYVKTGAVLNNVIFKPQIEFGDVMTGFEPYTKKTYTPSADGTCDIVSLSPTMTLLTDTEGVTVECEYIKDTNKAFSKVDQTYNPESENAQSGKGIEERLKSKVLLDITLTEEQAGANSVMVAIPDINVWYYAKQINFYVEMPFNAKAVSGETFSICVEDKDHSRYGIYYGYAYSVTCEQGQTLRFNSIVYQYSFENKQTPARQYVAFFAKPFMYEGPNSLGTADKMHGNYNTLSLYNSVPPYLSLKFANGTTFEVGTRIFMEVYY